MSDNEPKAKKPQPAPANAPARAPGADRVESLAREVFLRFLELPGCGATTIECKAEKAVEYAAAFYETWDQLKTEK